MSPLFIIIFGPTATGKSALAYQLATEMGANILSFDSRQLYRGMQIVTGQDHPPDNFPATIYGYSLVSPDQDFSIRHFYEYAAPIIQDHRQRQQPLILVGGSWPYAQVLLDPPATLFIPVNKKLRTQLEAKSVINLQTLLQDLDQDKWQSLNHSDQHNPRRLIRAIEVGKAGESEIAAPLLVSSEYKLIIHALPLKNITSNIRKRIEERLQAGALKETKQLMDKYSNWNTSAFSATGYQYLREYLENKIDLSTALELWFRQERDYARRQLTWIKSLS